MLREGKCFSHSLDRRNDSRSQWPIYTWWWALSANHPAAPGKTEHSKTCVSEASPKFSWHTSPSLVASQENCISISHYSKSPATHVAYLLLKAVHPLRRFWKSAGHRWDLPKHLLHPPKSPSVHRFPRLVAQRSPKHWHRWRATESAEACKTQKDLQV